MQQEVTITKTSAVGFNQVNFNSLPETGYLRIWQIIGDKKATPPIPALIPVSKSTFLNWVKSGKAPAPCKLSERTTAWKVESIKAFLAELGGAA